MIKSKNLMYQFVIMMIMVQFFCLTSCGSSDGDNSNDSGAVSGLYYCEVLKDSRMVYYFVNNNTVESYGNITRDANATWFGEKGQSFPYKTGWYYWSGNKRTMTYFIVEDRVVLSNGVIFIISGNTLLLDGSSNVFYKWN